MLFKNDFYRITSTSDHDGQDVFSIELNPNHHIFEGHFPDNPVTPGVVQMEIVKEMLEEKMGKRYRLSTLGNSKFLAILNPASDAVVDVVLKITEDEEALKLTAVIKNEDNTFLKMNASYHAL